MKIALDAGHGINSRGYRTGASANGFYEDDIALDMVMRIGHHLREQGLHTQLTRKDHNFLTIRRRVEIAKLSGCNLLVSIHLNAGPENASGAEVFVVEEDKRSKAIAEILIKKICQLGFKNRGVKWDNQGAHKQLGVLRGVYKQMPALLLELGFLTNEEDVKLIRNKDFREKLCSLIAKCCAEI